MSKAIALHSQRLPRLALLLLTFISSLTLLRSTAQAQDAGTAIPLVGVPYSASLADHQVLSEKFTDFRLITVDESALKTHPPGQQLTLQLALGQGLTGTAHLLPNDLRAPSYQATVTHKAGTIPVSNGQVFTYKGHLSGPTGGDMRLSLYPGHLSGYMQSEQGVRFLEPARNLLPTLPPNVYLTYTNTSIIPTGESICLGEAVHQKADALVPHSNSNHNHPSSAPQSSFKTGQGPGNDLPPRPLIPGQVTTNCHFLEIAIEEDYEWFLDFGGSVPAANAQALNILNQVEGLYCNDFSMIFQVTFQNIHSIPADPYTSTTLLARLNEFRTIWNTVAPFNTVQRDLAHMFTGTNFGGGPVGYAYVGVVCRTSTGYGITQNYNSGIYGQLVICAHEIGHNFTGAHGDAVSCGSLGSVMCPFVQSNSFYFSPATQSKFSAYIATRTCLKPDISISPAVATLCAGPTATFSVPFDPDWNYQWYLDSVAIGGATTDSYTASIPGTYIVEISDYDTTCTSCTVSLCAQLSSGNMLVTNTNDAGVGSLRQAIINANACPGWDTIRFDIPGTGPHTITPLSALPAATDTVFIDGYSQAGALPATASTSATLMIQLRGTSAGAAPGLEFDEDYCELAGLCITQFNGFGAGSGSALYVNNASFVKVWGNYLGTDLTGTIDQGSQHSGIYANFGSHNLTIGSANPEDFNLISGNDIAGIFLSGIGDTIRAPVIQGNYIGTDLTGSFPIANGDGVFCSWVTGLLLGGGATGEGNVISGNTQNGVNFDNIVYTSGVYGNKIGTDVSGTAPLGNGGIPSATPIYAGIVVNGSDITIGHSLTGWGNVISNNPYGIKLEFNNTRQGTIPAVDNILIWNNKIGTDINGINPMGNHATGVLVNYFGGASHTFFNLVGGAAPGFENIIANNGHLTGSAQAYDQAGVAFVSFGNLQGGTFSLARGNTKVFRNTIRNSAGKGIHIEPNAMQFPEEWKTPILTSVVRDCPTHTTTINGGLVNNSPNRQYRIEFFANFTPDAGGGEGEFFIGATNVTTDGVGNVSFSVPYNATRIPSGSCVSATATSQPTGNTSEFSNNMCVTLDPLVLTPQADQVICAGRNLSLLPNNPADSITWIVPSLGYITTDTLFYTPTVSETVILMAIDTCGRVGFDTINVSLAPIFDPALGNDTLICRGDTLTLDAGTGAVFYEWSDLSFGQTNIVTTSGVYSVLVVDGNFCSSIDSITILSVGPIVDLGIDTVFCPDGLLDAGFDDGLTYLWNTGDTLQYLPVDSAGIYQVTVTDSNGCVAEDTIVIALDTVVVDIGADTVFVSGDSLNAGHPGCTYLWNTGETTQVIYPLAPGNYTVQVICPGGCGNTDDIDLTPGGLPLESILLEGKLTSHHWVELEWICAPDDCVGDYTLSRAGTSLDFSPLEIGTTPATEKQIYLDRQPLIGTNYYQVRLDRQDGSHLLSNLKEIHWEPESIFTVYPVPATDELTLEWFFQQDSHLSIEVVDALGRIIWEGKAVGASGAERINCGAWAAGMYTVRAWVNGHIFVQKAIIR